MDKYIKSHSNFVLKSKHKTTNDGTIFERDWTTIGGVDSFAPNQVPIYRSGNFIITVNNENPVLKPYSSNDWKENSDGEVWTVSHVENVSANTEFKDNKIVIKNDYYELADFAYYGSCSDLIRGSLNDILTRFPSELFATNKTLDKYYIVENPSTINIYTRYLSNPQEGDELKYLGANDFSLNYDIFDANNNLISSAFTVEVLDGTPTCPSGDECNISVTYNGKTESESSGGYKYQNGDAMYVVNFKEGNTTLMTIYVVKDYDRKIYLCDSKYIGYHVRPKEHFLTEFYNSLSSFQSIILNPHTEPKYKASFQVTKETERGYVSSIEDFIFPIGDSGYNIGTNVGAYNAYVTKFLTISEFYDTIFCDNMYRMMTHESIKNMDWSRDIPNPKAEDYEEGEQKVSQLIRLFGRYFDEIKFYIDGIRNYNNITYSDRNNLPDYFMTDELETDGWDVNNIYPLILNEYTSQDCKEKKYRAFTESGWTSNSIDGWAVNEDTNSVSKGSETCRLYRTFSEDLETVIKPYANARLNDPNGYYWTCNGAQGSDNCLSYSKLQASEEDRNYKIDDSSTKRNVLRKKNIKYSSEKEYSFKDINSIFLKRLKLNSKHILTHKGTIEGIEMIMGMFGLTSRRFADMTNSRNYTNTPKLKYDYDIKEYTTFTKGIVDPIWDCKGMNRLNWYNSTKTILYSSNGEYVDYQGLPVIYRKENENTELSNNILYPYFNQNDVIDGNPYYQMDGGWLKNNPLSFDKDNNIINEETFTETLEYKKVVNTIKELVEIPINDLESGDIYEVNNLRGEYLLIDGYLYDVLYDYQNYPYISIQVMNNTLTIGSTTFTDDVYVSNPYGDCYENIGNLRHYNTLLLNNGENIKVYLDKTSHEIIAQDTLTNPSLSILITSQQYVNNEIFNPNLTSADMSNCFKLLNNNEHNIFNGNGWKQLSKNDLDYIRLNAIKNYSKGNNPHSGKLNYDNGFKYMDYFANLFNYSYNNGLFDQRKYRGGFEIELDYIGKIGFKDLVIEDKEVNCSDIENSNYPCFIDSKIHYFGDWFTLGSDTDIDWAAKNTDDDKDMVLDAENKRGNVHSYDVTDPLSWYDYASYEKNIECIKKQQITTELDENNYLVYSSATIDGSTYQIMNTKVVVLEIYLDCTNVMSKQYLEELKYYQSIVMPYITQMIPSTAILNINFKLKQ